MAKTLKTSPTLSDQALRDVLLTLQGASTDLIFASGALQIGTTSKKDVRMNTAVNALINGKLVAKSAAEVDLAGTVTNGKFNVFVITLSEDGTLGSYMGVEAATRAGVAFPKIPANLAVVGFVLVNPTGTGDFVGNTTDLDDATVVPNAVYINTPGGFNPNTISL